MNKEEIIERKIDEEFEHEGIMLKCIASDNCNGCFFDVRKNNYCNDRRCATDERSDRKSVKFIKIQRSITKN